LSSRLQKATSEYWVHFSPISSSINLTKGIISTFFPVSDIYFKTNSNETLQDGLRVEKRLAEDYFIVYLEVETEANNKTLKRSIPSLPKYLSKNEKIKKLIYLL